MPPRLLSLFNSSNLGTIKGVKRILSDGDRNFRGCIRVMRVSNSRKSEETKVFLVSEVFRVFAGAHWMGSIRDEGNQQ